MNKESDCIIKLIVYSNFKNVGTSSLISRYTNDKFIEGKASLDPDIFKIKLFNDENGIPIKVQIFDCGFKDFKKNYLRGVHGFLVVYDITNGESFKGVTLAIDDIITYGHDRSDQCTLIIGNKMDLESERKVDINDAIHYFQSKGIGSFFGEVSCKYSVNVNEAFQKLIQQTSNVLYNNINNNNNNRNKYNLS